MSLEKRRAIKALAVVMAAGLLAACGGGDKGNPARDATLVGAKGTTTVNRYLWAASLETLDFLPIMRADPVSGLLLTDWYSNPETPSERFKASVYILDTALRADALRVTIFRQELAATGQWVEATVNPATGREIENAILTRARQLRLNQLDK
ncbi:MAG: DUF3576 domain-containing protein [Parvularculaceae bacterium]|nr:DUF3576 domain-containing protein [Parvularculaceae bacterium]